MGCGWLWLGWACLFIPLVKGLSGPVPVSFSGLWSLRTWAVGREGFLSLRPHQLAFGWVRNTQGHSSVSNPSSWSRECSETLLPCLPQAPGGTAGTLNHQLSPLPIRPIPEMKRQPAVNPRAGSPVMHGCEGHPGGTGKLLPMAESFYAFLPVSFLVSFLFRLLLSHSHCNWLFV